VAPEEQLDPELLLQASLLTEIQLQCFWGMYHLTQLRDHIKKTREGPRPPGGWNEFLYHRSLVFAEVQSFLTCAAIVDSIVSGGAPPPRGVVPVSPETRTAIRRRLGLGDEFEVPGRNQRNGLVHIAERIIPWARPGGMRGDFLTGIAKETTQAQLEGVLRALDFETLEFGVLGETCNLNEVESALRKLYDESERASGAVLDELSRGDVPPRSGSPAPG
jgi:hypothetical protein